MTSQIATPSIEQIAHGSIKTLKAKQIQINATYICIDQAIIPLANLAKVAHVRIYKPFAVQPFAFLAAALTILMGLRSTILLEQAQNLLSAGIILWLLYIFYDHLGWRDQEGLLVMPNTSSQGACLIVHENPEFIGQMLETIKQALTQPEIASYTIDCKTQMIKAL